MKDIDGNELTPEELRKILRQNSSYQFNWWKAKPQPRTGDSKPPRGVRENVAIKKL
jgi:hypothetical protein